MLKSERSQLMETFDTKLVDDNITNDWVIVPPKVYDIGIANQYRDKVRIIL